MRISVIIPTLNEEGFLARAIEAVRLQNPHQIIVVDAGSVDKTHYEAAEADLFMVAPRGRARQMNSAAQYATGDILLFIHADCCVENGCLAEAERLLEVPGVAAGCFRQRVADGHWAFRCIDWSAIARVRLTGIAYGDQGLFLTRRTFLRVGGFPDVPMMEDLLICRRLRQHGRMLVAQSRILVSPRRWNRAGIIAQTVRNWGLTALAVAGVSPNSLARYYPALR